MKDKFFEIELDNKKLNLYCVYIVNEYECTPIVFICVDDDKNLYVCLCSEIRYELIWTISKSNIDIITKMLTQKLSFYNAIKQGSEFMYARYGDVNGVDEYTFKKLKFDEIDPLNLPSNDKFMLRCYDDINDILKEII